MGGHYLAVSQELMELFDTQDLSVLFYWLKIETEVLSKKWLRERCNFTMVSANIDLTE
jgi:hypothetical protein